MAKTDKAKPRWSWTAAGRHLSVGTDARKIVIGIIVTVFLLTLTFLNTDSFFRDNPNYGMCLYILCLCACPIVGLIVIFPVHASKAVDIGVSTVVVFLLPIVAMTMVECLNGVFTWDWSPQTLILNYILYLLFYGFVYLFSGSYRLPMLIVNPLVFVLSLANFYVMAFRGTPFIPLDFYAIGTAANVVASYHFFTNYQVVIAVILLVFLEAAAVRLTNPELDIIGKIATRVFFGILIGSIVCIYFFTDQYAQAGLSPDFWNQARGYRKTGVVMNFCLNTKYLFSVKPADYDPDAVEGVIRDAAGEEDDPADAASPNIIVIMNESLADLSVLGDVHTNKDYMPFLHSLTENTVRGNLYVPVIGSGTSNTEYEFLTGVSTSFFPAGSNAYMLYVKQPMPSLTSVLMDQGYTARAFHPYYASGWNRTAVYKNFGFQKFTSIGSVISNDLLVDYQNTGYDAQKFEEAVEKAYPGKNILLRRYVSDEYNYQKVIQMYKNRDKSQPFFLFNVTMQNHGGYTETADNFRQEIYVTDGQGNRLTRTKSNGTVVDAYPKANQYYSLIKRSDDAFKELVAYFSKQKSPTVICMFGDHQPNIETDYIADLMGVDSIYDLSTEENQKRYVTPFYIWANYPLKETTVERLSVNYLAAYLSECAGIRTTAFQRYLLDLSKTLPVIDTVGIIDKDGAYYDNGASSPYDDLIGGYRNVVYNLVHDTANRKDDLFRLVTAQ